MITIERLLELGWRKGDFYPAGSSKEYGREYFYEGKKHRVRVNEKTGEILSYDGHPTRLIKDEIELEKYDN